MNETNFKPRHFVFQLALLIEDNVTSFLAALLDISRENSKTLSNKSSSLSFKTKVDLLTDIKALKKEDAIKFIIFMEIRNQFMHNLKSNSFVNCFSYLNGNEKKILKLYPPKNSISEKEDQLKTAFIDLFIDLTNILDRLLDVLRNKGYKEGLAKRNEIAVESLSEIAAGSEQAKVILDLINKKIQDSKE